LYAKGFWKKIGALAAAKGTSCQPRRGGNLVGNKRLWETFKSYTEVYSPSFGERELCVLISKKLEAMGAQVREESIDGFGNCGNLYAFLPGKLSGSPLLFSSHMDTVEPALGKRAILHEDGKITSAGDTILGADDIAGISIILEAITRLDESGTPRRDIELLLTVAEELYGAGSRVFNYDMVKSKEAYVLDLSGAIGEAANAAPTIVSYSAVVRGKASHAGFAPLKGISAIRACSAAIARLPLGEPKPGLTCNIGLIAGGTASNIVPDLCEAKGEIRSLRHDEAMAMLAEVKAVFEDEASAIGCSVEILSKIEIEAYETGMGRPVSLRFQRACEAAGVPCHIHSTMGGSDNNNFAIHGIEGLVVACAMHDVHSSRENSDLNEMEQCVKLVEALMSEVEPDEDSA
jgi:tripeptide aminopeptidase